jgi:hypothetical protein
MLNYGDLAAGSIPHLGIAMPIWGIFTDMEEHFIAFPGYNRGKASANQWLIKKQEAKPNKKRSANGQPLFYWWAL